MPDARALAAARRWTNDADRVGDPYATAELFAGAIYWDEDFWQFEKWALFEREWLCVGHVGQIPAAGDHLSITPTDDPLIVARDAAGAIEVRSARRAAIRHEVFEGLIFVNFAADAAPLGPRLGRLRDLVANFGIAALHPTATTSTGQIASNWKIYQENSLEPYHTDVVHKTSHNPAPANLSAFFEHRPDEAAIFTTTGFAETSELFAADGHPQLPGIAGLADDEMRRILFVAVLPGLFMLLEPGSVLVTLALPRGADAMELLTFSLYPIAATVVPDFQGIVARQQAALATILGEDLTTQEALQRGHRSRFTPKGVLSWLETTIPQMNGWLLHRYRAALAEADGALAGP